MGEIRRKRGRVIALTNFTMYIAYEKVAEPGEAIIRDGGLRYVKLDVADCTVAQQAFSALIRASDVKVDFRRVLYFEGDLKIYAFLGGYGEYDKIFVVRQNSDVIELGLNKISMNRDKLEADAAEALSKANLSDKERQTVKEVIMRMREFEIAEMWRSIRGEE